MCVCWRQCVLTNACMYNMHLNAHLRTFQKSRHVDCCFCCLRKFSQLSIWQLDLFQHVYCIARYVLFVLIICGCVKTKCKQTFITFSEVDQLTLMSAENKVNFWFDSSAYKYIVVSQMCQSTYRSTNYCKISNVMHAYLKNTHCVDKSSVCFIKVHCCIE